MIRLCKDTPDIHGFHPCYPNWQNYVKLLNDMDEMVVLSGKEQEEWLDANNIYYVHVESKPKESFETFKRRMYRQIEENKEYIETSTSFGKLVFALTKSSMEKGNVSTDNIVEIWRRNSDNKYSLRLDLPDNVSDHTYYLLVKCIKGIFKESLGTTAAEGITISELTSPEFNLFTSDTLPGMLYRLQILEDLFKNGYVNVDVADDEYPPYEEEDYEDECPCDECPCDEDPCDEDPVDECPLHNVAEEQEQAQCRGAAQTDPLPNWKEITEEEFNNLSEEDKEKIFNQALEEVIPAVASMLLGL